MWNPTTATLTDHFKCTRYATGWNMSQRWLSTHNYVLSEWETTFISWRLFFYCTLS